MDQTILGLPLESKLPDDWSEGGYHVSPVSALTIVKAIDSDGDEVHAVLFSEGMSFFEASALVNFGLIYTNEMLRKSFKSAKDGSSKKK